MLKPTPIAVEPSVAAAPSRPPYRKVAVALVLLTPILHGLPWLVPDLGPIGWVAIACASWLICRGGRLGGFWVTWAWSSVAIAMAFHWSPQAMAYTLSSGYSLGLIVSLPLIFWDGLRLSLGYWLAGRITRDVRWYWLPAALIAIALEYLMPGVFPWCFGHMQLEMPWLLQAVDVFGTSWTTFLAFAISAVLVQASDWLARRMRPQPAGAEKFSPVSLSYAGRPLSSLAVVLPTAVVVANALYCTWAYAHWTELVRSAPKMRAALVQVDPSYVGSQDKMRGLTAQIADKADLVCWPESSGGTYELALDSLQDPDTIFKASRDPVRGLRPWPQPRCELLLGGKNYVGQGEEPDQLFVTAMLLDCSEKIVGRYHKRYLMPFGEYVPGEGIIPGMAELFDMADHFTRGDGPAVITSATGAKIGAMLCYEDMVPEVARLATQHDANVIVSLINGSAFESPYTLWQHRMLAHLRALETRRYFLRCAATGETCIISPLGVIESRLPVQTTDVLVGSVALLDEQPLAVHLPWLTPSLTLFGLVSIILYQRRARRAERLQHNRDSQAD